MKKALILSVLIVFLFNSMGYYLLFEVNRQMARSEMRNAIKIHPARLSVLTIADVENNKEFKRIDRKEFMYKGEMFDIVRELKSGPATVFVCRHDVKDTKLFAGLKRASQGKVQLALWDNLVTFFLNGSSTGICPSFSGTWKFPNIVIPLKSSPIPTWSPPPEQS